MGVEIALKSHEKISKFCTPVYCINKKMLKKASNLLSLEIPNDFNIHEVKGEFDIKPGKVSKKAENFLMTLLPRQSN